MVVFLLPPYRFTNANSDNVGGSLNGLTPN